MKWGDNARDSDTILAAWPVYEPLFGWWAMYELADNGKALPAWRSRRIPHDTGVKMDIYRDEDSARQMASALNIACEIDLENRSLDANEKKSLRLKVSKSLQAKDRLASEEKLMLSEAIRRHKKTEGKNTISLAVDAEPYRNELLHQLGEMPYLEIAIVGVPGERKVLVLSTKGVWNTYYATKRSASIATRARIANGFGFSALAHWGKVKAKIREILLPRANKLLQLASVQRMLAEALAQGKHVLVCNGIVFWYEADGEIGWQVKSTSKPSESNESALWKEGKILSTNHGRIVVLPYVKETGEYVSGHTKNAPHDGKAKPRHPDHYVEIPFEMLDGDLMIGLFGELPYE